LRPWGDELCIMRSWYMLRLLENTYLQWLSVYSPSLKNSPLSNGLSSNFPYSTVTSQIKHTCWTTLALSKSSQGQSAAQSQRISQHNPESVVWHFLTYLQLALLWVNYLEHLDGSRIRDYFRRSFCASSNKSLGNLVIFASYFSNYHGIYIASSIADLVYPKFLELHLDTSHEGWRTTNPRMSPEPILC